MPPRRGKGNKGKKKISVASSSSSSSSSSAVINSIDLLLEILLRLPLESLVTCKSVSDRWDLLISGAFFTRNYFLQNPLPVLGLYWIKNDFGQYGDEPVYSYINLDGNNSNYDPFETLGFDGIDFPVKIVQSCNGLFLCSSCPSHDNNKCVYYICNPFTNQYRRLPISRVRNSEFKFSNNVSLAYDPFRSGYYKVVCMWNNGASLVHKHIEIYSSKTSSWRRCGDEYVVNSTLKMPGVFWNGSLHWIRHDASLIYFNIEREVIGEVASHRQDARSFFAAHTVNSFGEYGGHLFCIELSDSPSSRFHVLEMDTDYSGWNSKYAVDLGGLTGLYPGFSHSGYNLISFKEEEEGSPKLTILIHESEIVISYDPETASFGVIGEVAPRHYTEDGVPSQEAYSFLKYIVSLARV